MWFHSCWLLLKQGKEGLKLALLLTRDKEVYLKKYEGKIAPVSLQATKEEACVCADILWSGLKDLMELLMDQKWESGFIPPNFKHIHKT